MKSKDKRSIKQKYEESFYSSLLTRCCITKSGVEIVKRIVVVGANGNMGRTVVKMIAQKQDFELVGAVDVTRVGEDIHQILGLDAPTIRIDKDLSSLLEAVKPDLAIDFTTPEVVADNIQIVVEQDIDMIVGTTGISEEELIEIRKLTQGKNSIIMAPNFAIGAVLMMQFAKKAVKFMKDVEIIELHHNRKAESPSGTAVKTAELIGEILSEDKDDVEELEKITGVRGGEMNGVNIHSVRLPGFVSHQEVIFGGLGQTLTIRFDSISRESFMPGLELAINRIDEIEGVVYGVENLIDI